MRTGFKAELTQLWAISAILLTAMWGGWLAGNPVWPLRDILHCTAFMVAGNLGVGGLVYCAGRRTSSPADPPADGS